MTKKKPWERLDELAEMVAQIPKDRRAMSAVRRVLEADKPNTPHEAPVSEDLYKQGPQWHSLDGGATWHKGPSPGTRTTDYVLQLASVDHERGEAVFEVVKKPLDAELRRNYSEDMKKYAIKLSFAEGPSRLLKVFSGGLTEENILDEVAPLLKGDYPLEKIRVTVDPYPSGAKLAHIEIPEVGSFQKVNLHVVLRRESPLLEDKW